MVILLCSGGTCSASSGCGHPDPFPLTALQVCVRLLWDVGVNHWRVTHPVLSLAWAMAAGALSSVVVAET